MSAPAIHWWHMPQDLSQQEGMQRASTSLALIAKGGQDAKISGDEDTRRLVTSGLHAIINCVRQGDHHIFTIIIVAGNNDVETRAIMEGIRGDMLSGVFE